MSLSRRQFLTRGAAFSAGFAGLQSLLATRAWAGEHHAPVGYGDLVPDPGKILDLPKGFSYTVISRVGEEMSDGLLVPGLHDGTGAFAGPDGLTILVRNHEISPEHGPVSAFGPKWERIAKVASDHLYDIGGPHPAPGGTTTLVYDTRTRTLKKHFLSLAGTLQNCAGGITPWGSWLTCEETTATKCDLYAEDHGFVFEVPAAADSGLVRPVPIKPMGRFKHEAVAIDPRTGIVYLTEDLGDGVLYRYIPAKPGNLLAGGRLQALCVRERDGLDTYNHKGTPAIRPGEPMSTRWIDLEDVLSPDDSLRKQAHSKGAARFARNEGVWFGDRAFFFSATIGGIAGMGQVWKYSPSPDEGTAGEDKSPGRLELFCEPNDGEVLKNCDNLTVSPWGDLFICEDPVGPGRGGLVGVTPDGRPYRFARNRMNTSELTGACFSPDRTTLFVNIQHPGLTLAITGPWEHA